MQLPSLATIDLPPGIEPEDAKEHIRQYAPELRLHGAERHFPSDPERFRQQSRFRASMPGRDQGWNHTSQTWSIGDKHTPEHYGPPWDQVATQTLKQFPETGRLHPPTSANLRPRDSGNLLGPGNVTGLFLQRAQQLADQRSGPQPGPDRISHAPIFVDTAFNAQEGVIRVLYWFFYELNFWRFFLTHEGDWEHVTLVFTEDAFREGAEPSVAYFAQHNTGLPLSFDQLTFAEGRHPIVYVDRNGHPCRPSVADPNRYRYHWKTWTEDLHFVSESAWRDFAGAWGEVGETTHTTGPLGPFFKRHQDLVAVQVREGRLHVRTGSTGR